MDDEEKKVVRLHGGSVHHTQTDVQLTAPQKVLDDLPMDEAVELVTLIRCRDGQVYIASTHSRAHISLLLGEAAYILHREAEPYG